jgi:hypothetical protein
VGKQAGISIIWFVIYYSISKIVWDYFGLTGIAKESAI